MSGNSEHRPVDEQVQTRRAVHVAPLRVDDLHEVASELLWAPEAAVGVVLDGTRCAVERTVELGLQLVTHDEVRRRGGQRDDDRDDAGRDEREAGPERHGSRMT